MAKFEFDATDAIRAVTTFSSKVKQVGIELDALELSKSLTTSVRSVDRVFEGLEASVKLSRSELDRLGSSFNTLRFTGEAAVTGIVAAQQKAYITLKAYTDQNNVLNKVLRDTDSKNIQISTTRTLNTLQEKAAADLAILSERTNLLSTAEGRSLAVAKELAKAKTLMATQGDRLKITLAQQTEQQKLLNDADAKAVANNRIIISALERSATAAARLAAEEIKLRTEKELGNSATAKNIAALKAEDAARRQAEKAKQADLDYYQKKTSEVAKLRRELRYLKTDEARQAALLQQQVTAERRALVESTEAVAKSNSRRRIANQLTASMRASLAGLQTSIGMYTSSTIIAASVTYAFARALRSGLEVGIEFTAAMARTEAIMSSSASGALFASLESQVRLLGQTTQFTVTQVAEAATELGQAGLSAGQSIIALQPALDLAIIGNLSMATSADHATNIMMIFGKEATDLSSIVDTLAMAVTNSNTNIDQLANALTYAGPAAQALGISMEDTVAAVESLANSGFKASRAGTALRRLFVSLANPTKKGQEVLDKYNISVTDLYGNARDLTDILQQMQEAFEGLSGAERLTAIQNLVGVYATSPVAGLLENVDNFVALRTQLELSAGAAERMKAKIEDALKFDLREVKSAFEELQLSVFKNNEQQLRVWAQEITAFIRHLGDAADGGATNLEKYAEKIKNYGVALGYIYAAAKVVPVLQRFGERAGVASATTLSASSNTLKFAKSTMGLAMQMNASTSAIVRNTGAITANAAAGVLATRQAAATGAAVLMRGAASLTGIGTAAVVAYSAWQVVTAIFGKSDLPASIEEQEVRVSGLKGAYSELTKEAKAYQAVRTQRILAEQVVSLEDEIEATKLKLDAETLTQKVLKESGAEHEFINSQLVLTKKHLEDLKSTYTTITASLGTQKTLQEQLDINTTKLQNLNEQSAFVMGDQVEFQKELNVLTQERLGLLQQIGEVTRTNTISAALSAGDNIAFGDYNTAISELAGNSTSSSDTLYSAGEEVANLMRVRDSLRSVMEAADAGDAAAKAQYDVVVEQWEQNSKSLNKALGIYATAVAGFGKANLDLSKTWKGADFDALSDVQKRVTLTNELLTLEQQDAANRTAFETGGILDPVKAKETADRLAEVKSQLVSLNKEVSGGPKGNRTLEEAIKLSDNLRTRYDSVGQSAKKRQETESQLQMLVQLNLLSTGDYSKALTLLAKDHYAVERAANVHQAAADRIVDTYLKSSNDKAIKDLIALEDAYKNTAMSAETYAKAREAIYASTRGGELPQMDLSQANSSGPFSEVLSTVGNSADVSKQLEEAKAKEILDHEKHKEFLASKRADAIQANQDLLGDTIAAKEAEQAINEMYQREELLAAELHSDEMGRIANAKIQQTADSQKLLLASMAGSMSNLLGMIGDASAEASTGQKLAFAASKALAVAQILLNTHVAASRANAELPVFMGMTMSQLIMANGYASAGLVGALAIGQLSGSGGGNYAGAYDKGGYIPTGKYGIVGEYGPEIVNGPANVTGREATARKLNSGGDSGPQQVTIAPVIQIEYTSEGEGGTSQDAAVLGNAIKLVVLDTMRDQLRPNGMLHKRT